MAGLAVTLLGLERVGVAINRESRGGIEVTLGTNGALVGDTHHWFSLRGIPQLTEVGFNAPGADPRWLEFRSLYRPKKMHRAPAALRIPFPPNAMGEALRVFDHYDSLLQPRGS